MSAREVALIQLETDKMERKNKEQNVLYRRNPTVYARLYITTSSFWWGIGATTVNPSVSPRKQSTRKEISALGRLKIWHEVFPSWTRPSKSGGGNEALPSLSVKS